MILTFQTIVSKYPMAAEMASVTREFLFSHLPEISEYPDSSANIIGYGYGSGYKDMIVAIILSKKGIKVGFYKGADLPDPAGLLGGSGKVHKYVEIKSSADLNQALKKLLKEALKAYKARIVK